MVKSNRSRFEVEEIRDKKQMQGRTVYLVKWKDYPDSENTWEPRKHLRSCHTLIQDYEEKLKHQLDMQQLQELLDETAAPVKSNKPVFEVRKETDFDLETWYEVDISQYEVNEFLKIAQCSRNSANIVEVEVEDSKQRRLVFTLEDMLEKDPQLLLQYLCQRYADTLP